MRFRFHGLAVVGVLCGAVVPPLAATEIAVLEARSEPPFELLSPRAGDVLTAGGTVTLEWQALPALAEARQIDEWEAFLSVDGGASYPLRLTPHMEIDQRRVTLEVPDLPTRDARLLFRLGDGKRDFAWRLPLRLSIAASVTPRRLLEMRREPGRGEPALHGEPGVAAWVEKSVSGAGLEWVFAGTEGLFPRPNHEINNYAAFGSAVLLPAVPAVPEPRPWQHPQEPPENLAAAVPPPESLPAVDILAWTQRLNE